jgi:hypothetical protein
MELTTMQMYWLVMLDKFIYTGWFLLIFFGVATLFAIGMLADDLVKKWCPITTAALSFVGLAIVTFTPNIKQMAAIMIVPKIANSEKVQTIGNKVYDLAVEWMNELKPAKKEGAK